MPAPLRTPPPTTRQLRWRSASDYRPGRAGSSDQREGEDQTDQAPRPGATERPPGRNRGRRPRLRRAENTSTATVVAISGITVPTVGRCQPTGCRTASPGQIPIQRSHDDEHRHHDQEVRPGRQVQDPWLACALPSRPGKTWPVGQGEDVPGDDVVGRQDAGRKELVTDSTWTICRPYQPGYCSVAPGGRPDGSATALADHPVLSPPRGDQRPRRNRVEHRRSGSPTGFVARGMVRSGLRASSRRRRGGLESR